MCFKRNPYKVQWERQVLHPPPTSKKRITSDISLCAMTSSSPPPGTPLRVFQTIRRNASIDSYLILYSSLNYSIFMFRYFEKTNTEVAQTIWYKIIHLKISPRSNGNFRNFITPWLLCRNTDWCYRTFIIFRSCTDTR